jgi:hypothetical protein
VSPSAEYCFLFAKLTLPPHRHSRHDRGSPRGQRASGPPAGSCGHVTSQAATRRPCIPCCLPSHCRLLYCSTRCASGRQLNGCAQRVQYTDRPLGACCRYLKDIVRACKDGEVALRACGRAGRARGCLTVRTLVSLGRGRRCADLAKCGVLCADACVRAGCPKRRL